MSCTIAKAGVKSYLISKPLLLQSVDITFLYHKVKCSFSKHAEILTLWNCVDLARQQTNIPIHLKRKLSSLSVVYTKC